MSLDFLLSASKDGDDYDYDDYYYYYYNNYTCGEASCKTGTGSFPGVRCGRGVTLTPLPLLVPRSKIE